MSKERDIRVDITLRQIEQEIARITASSGTPPGLFYRPPEQQRPAPAAPEPPVFSECVIGYREWVLDPLGQLRAITMQKQVWSPGANTAKCRPHDQAAPPGTVAFFAASLAASLGGLLPGVPSKPETHAAPAPGCHCGLYAWNDFPDTAREMDWSLVDGLGTVRVLGAVAAWGDVQVHRTGFRAEHACVTALAWHESMSPRLRAALERVAAEYRVPLVHLDTLQAEAERHGTPLPAAVRPTPNLEASVDAYQRGGRVPSGSVHYAASGNAFWIPVAKHPTPRLQVYALTRADAKRWAQQEGLRADDWAFVEDPREMSISYDHAGRTIDNLVFVGRPERRPDWVAMEKLLGRYGLFPSDIRWVTAGRKEDRSAWWERRFR